MQRWLFANIPGAFTLLELPHSGTDPRALGEQQRPHLRADLDVDVALPRGSCSSHVPLHWLSPQHSLTAQVLLHRSWRALKVWELAVCLPSADKSHLSRPFLPNTEQYLAQGSYLNVDLQHKAETDLFSLQQQ